MEAGHSCQEESTCLKSSASVCETLDEVPCDRVDILPIQTGSCVDQQTSGKQKKNPFKFFGGRKSICTLPSFFGGKHKGLGKGNSRKSVSKSKTHDGISDVHAVDNKEGYKDNTISRYHGGDPSTPGCTLPSSYSADSGITSPVKLDFNYHDMSPMGSTECFEKKVNGDKSFSFPRPKKGLKGLFSSIRRHKKNKTLDPEKCERYDHITQSVILEQLNRYSSEDGGLQDSSEQPKISHLHSDISSLTVTVESEKEELPACSVSISDIPPQKTDELLVENCDVPSVDQNPISDSKPDGFIDCSDPKEVSAESGKPESDRDPLPSAADQLSLMFEDVSSLKSFDSFTGCGDIIAEQDIDNISDNSISVERSREATKRSSCLVTYQGGGEEMATPDDMEEEYLQQLLENGNEADASYGMEDEKEHDNMSKSFTELEPNAYAMAAEDAFVDRSVLNNTELLTPQSDQQESAPNSDEGYYDSNTPGPDDDGGEGFSQKERLPRDSYSGDALYEFYEPDDSLMSPAPGGESLYDNKTICSEIFDQFFDFSLPVDNDLIQNIEHKLGATETEEERLAVIQKQLLFWERQREAAMKGMDHLGKDIFSKENQNLECEIRTASLTGKNKDYLMRDQYVLPNFNKDGADKGLQNAQPDKLGWKDTLTDAIKQDGYMRDLKGNGFVEDSGFELNVDGLGTQDQNVARVTNVSKLSNPNVAPMDHVQNVFDSDFSSISGYSQENDCEQAVNFSETLVEFANNGMLFSSISERLGNTGSSSSFHHTLNALPTMVTFDIVDVENEGECEQQLDLSPGEDVASSFEGFDHSYVQESLAECDEQLLQMDSHHSFQSYNWGVTSLPRHLDHYKLSPSSPVPLSLNRRSKSLDTERLELELGALHMPKSGLKSCDDLVPWEDEKTSHLQELSCVPGEFSAVNRCDLLEQIVPTKGQFETYTPVLPLKQGYSREPRGSSSSSQLPGDTRQMANTIDLLQCNTRQSQEDSISFRYSRENTTKILARVPPLEELRGVHIDYSYDYHTPQKQTRIKPVGITQAMPQQHKQEDFGSLPDYLERSDPTKKGSLDLRGRSANDWSNSHSECSNS
ncbi:APC membrane recruitment protein 1 [Bufo bufo]|uniref:APC membrane recruitment protein 1 n=1 Tax=Bufo bufo TaxID=8384 RepID=UPI001ABE23F4|nr:APC membrane recruitment protein 1 [Bufo bufo]